jgi:hypothetical protein
MSDLGVTIQCFMPKINIEAFEKLAHKGKSDYDKSTLEKLHTKFHRPVDIFVLVLHFVCTILWQILHYIGPCDEAHQIGMSTNCPSIKGTPAV